MIGAGVSGTRFAEVLPAHNGRRSELAAFLRARRDRLTPERLGLPLRARRRTAGLRREEVAELAGISVGLYTWLEQGRDVPVSERTIDAICDALELSEGERRYVQHLTQRTTPDVGDEPGDRLHRMVRALQPNPAFALDYLWNIVAANAAARTVFAAAPAVMARDTAHSARNVLEYLYLDERARRLFAAWERVAQSMLETFRFDLASHLEDSRARTLVNDLHASSPEFSIGWAQQRIRTHPDATCSLAHPLMGSLQFEATLVTPNESPRFRLLIFAPDDDDTAAKVGATAQSPIHSPAPCRRSPGISSVVALRSQGVSGGPSHF